MTEIEIYGHFKENGGLELSNLEVQAVKSVLDNIQDDLRHKPLLDAYMSHLHLCIMIEAIDRVHDQAIESTQSPTDNS